EDLVYLAVNVFWEEQTFCLPALPGGYAWRLAVNTAAGDPAQCCTGRVGEMTVIDSEFIMHPRSAAVFVGAQRDGTLL
ncbi:MAG: glycogen debranching enzyme, partial [Eubacteriales bacterium]|nr:glycogen debranching enzyme [Eubacteriales bacterium]